jgi:two-component system, sensor histidine kinase YesM
MKKTASYHRLLCCVFATMLMAAAPLCAQTNEAPAAVEQKKQSSGKSKKLKEDADKLDQAISNQDPGEIAASYEQLADGYLKKGEYAKAESFYLKAQPIFEKLGNQDALARVLRGVAKSQEWQNRGSEAYGNYQRSGQIESNKSENAPLMSKNDMRRMENVAKPAEQTRYANENLAIVQSSGTKAEVAESYGQLGDIQMAQNNVPEAVKNYEQAVQTSDTPEDAVKYSDQLANVYTSTGNYKQAFDVQQSVLQRSDVQADASQKIAVIQSMATILAKSDSKTEALKLFDESYRLALTEHRTLDAKSSLENMALIYAQQGNTQSAIKLYCGFVSHLDTLLPKDKSLLDNQLTTEIEARIVQLEEEKQLKDQLITRKNRFNAVLIGASCLLALMVALIARALYAIRVKNKKIALQSLRREMNPHFIFNSLNSVNQFIAQNDELAANQFLTAYSHLMRSTMEHSNKDFVRLSEEIEMARKYLALEKQRFPKQFDYIFDVAPDLDTDAVDVPNMLLQPHLENAIWHGLRYLDHCGQLTIRVEQIGKQIRIEIDDTGIGLRQSKALKTTNQQAHQSRGTTNTQERIDLLNQLYKRQIRCTIVDKSTLNASEQGTLVTISYQIA